MDVAYLDNAATTYKKPQEVHDYMYQFYNANSVNVGRGNHKLLEQSNILVRETRDLLLALFNANYLYEAILTPTATEAINVVLQGQKWTKTDIVYISPFEHNAVYRTIKHLEKTYGFTIRILSYDKTNFSLDIEAIKLQFSQESPTFVIVTHVSNVCGKIIDIYALGRILEMYDARFLVDCSQSAGLLNTNIIKCQADYMVFAGHKTLYGPFGCSGFICKKESAPSPLIYGGTGIDSANEDMPIDLPSRLEAGSLNILAIAGLNASLKWINKTGIENIQKRESENYQKLNLILQKYNFITRICYGGSNASIISCVFDNLAPDNVGSILSNHNVIVRTGLHCAPLAHKTLGTYPAGTIRFSISYYTNENDFEILNDALEMIREKIDVF